MHELSIGEAIVDAVVDRAAGRKVLAVSIRVGEGISGKVVATGEPAFVDPAPYSPERFGR